MAVNRFVDPRLKARDPILIGLDADVAARAAARTDRRGLLQIPNSDLETKIAIRERAHGADVDHIGRQRIVEHGALEQRNGRMIAAVDHGEFIGFGDLLAKAHAARTLDAALAVEDDIWPENRSLAVVYLANVKAALLTVMLHVIILQPALARLIADRTVDRVIDQQKLQNGFAHRQDFWTLC